MRGLPRLRSARARVLGIPLAVHPSFLLLVCALAWWTLTAEFPLWTFVCRVFLLFVSVLAHEFGHALVLRLFGVRGHGITIHGLGGHVKWDGEAYPLGNAAAFTVAFAGPLAGFAVSAAAFAVVPFAADHFTLAVAGQLAAINLYLSIANLLPVIPLDGGWMLYHALCLVAPRRSPVPGNASVFVSALGATFMLAAAYRYGNVFLLLVGGQSLLFCALATERLFRRPD